MVKHVISTLKSILNAWGAEELKGGVKKCHEDSVFIQFCLKIRV